MTTFSIGVNNQSIIITNQDTGNTNNVSALITSDNGVGAINYDAICEIRSTPEMPGTLLLPRLSNADVANITAVAGMTYYNSDSDMHIAVTNNSGNVLSNEIVTQNAVTGNIILKLGADIVFTTNEFSNITTLQAAANTGINIDFTLPSSPGNKNDVLVNQDGAGTFEWSNDLTINTITLPATNKLTVTDGTTFTTADTNGNVVIDGALTVADEIFLPNSGGGIFFKDPSSGEFAGVSIQLNPSFTYDSVNINLPTSNGLSDHAFITDGNSNTSWQAIVNNLTITGDSNIIPTGAANAATGNVDVSFTLNSTPTVNSIILQNQTANTTISTNPALTQNTNFILPPNNGQPGQFLQTDGNGNLAWVYLPTSDGASGKNILTGTRGTVVLTSFVTATSIINVNRDIGTIGTISSVTSIGSLTVGNIVPGISFTVYSTVETDTDGFDWLIVTNNTVTGKNRLNGLVGVTINDNNITPDSVINITRNVRSLPMPSVTDIGNLTVGLVSNGSFTVYSTVETDTAYFDWFIADSNNVNTFSGTGTVNTPVAISSIIAATSIICVTRNIGSNTMPTVTTIGNLTTASIVNNTSFTVYSTVNGDVGSFNWFVINP